MYFSSAFIDDLKGRVPVSQLVRKRVKLFKAGREWKGLSPFTQEKSPSFFVNDHKMAWFDFSSGKTGDIFDFLVETEGITFQEAVERVAAEAGVHIPVSTQEDEKREKRRASLQEIMLETIRFYQTRLREPLGKKAQDYLKNRGLWHAESLQSFQIGYSPQDRFALRQYLVEKGASLDLLAQAGLLIQGEDISVPYDRFRDRIIFPIHDRAGRPIAFGGRALDPHISAKYLNSPETELFHKGAILYNHHRARKSAHEKNNIIAVEGYIDVISLTQAGFSNVVAPLGTALTIEQCQLLWSMAPEPVLCFDGDRAGRKAAQRALELVLPYISPERTLRFAFLPEGKDPDELVRHPNGPLRMREILDAPLPLVDVLWSQEFDAQSLDTPERRAHFERRLHARLKEIRDETLQRYYREEFRLRLTKWRQQAHTREQPFYEDHVAFRRRSLHPPPNYISSPPKVSEYLGRLMRAQTPQSLPHRESLILYACYKFPEFLGQYAEDLAHLKLDHPELRSLREILLGLALEETPPSHPILKKLEEAVRNLAPAFFRKPPDMAEIHSILQQALAFHLYRQRLEVELQEAEQSFAESFTPQAFERLQQVKRELAAAEGMTETSGEYP